MMHQPCEQIIEEPVDFNKLVEVMNSATPIVGHPLTAPIGKRCFIPVKAKKQNMLFEFFAETVLTEQPENLREGYSENDVKSYKGVTVLNLIDELDSDKEDAQFNGAVWGFGDFLEEFVEDKTLQLVLSRIMEDIQLEANSIIGDKLLDRANDLWMSRLDDEIFKITYH